MLGAYGVSLSLLPLVNRMLRTAEVRGSAIAAGRAWHGTADSWTFDDNGAIDSDGNKRRRYRLGSLGALLHVASVGREILEVCSRTSGSRYHHSVLRD